MNKLRLFFGILLAVTIEAGCGPTVQQMQSDLCQNASFSREWSCIEEKLDTNGYPRRALAPQWVSSYRLYGDKLDIAVREGSMTDVEASLLLLQYSDALDRDLWNRMHATSQ